MNILIDNFPFELSHTDLDDGDIVLGQAGVWMGPVTEETEHARLKGLKDAWVNADERRKEHADRLKVNRYEGPTHVNGMSKEHKANLSKSGMGNQNARKKPKVL